MGERLSLIAAADIGGTSESSDYSWQAFGVVGYRFGLFGNNNANLLAGYKGCTRSTRTATVATSSIGTSPSTALRSA